MSLLAQPQTFDDSFVTVSATASVAVATIELPAVRERQAMIMQHRLVELAEQSRGRLAVGFTQVGDMTSACINALIEVNRHCRRLGGKLVIFGLTRALVRLFASTGLDRVLTVAPDTDAALRAFAPQNRARWSLFRGRTNDAA